jgi:dehydrogenase/reductase SDR family member 7B
MNDHFNNKVAWITGASSGIGEFLAYAMSARGARLVLSGRRVEELERVKKACTNPGSVQILPLDLADIPSLEGKVEAAIAFFGEVDIMVHNGGVTQRGLVLEMELEVHRGVMEVDYFSYVVLTKALLPHFIARKAGHFVVTSSVMGKIGTPMRSAYAAAKHALHGFFDCLRAEVSPNNVKVTMLTPGYIRTNISSYATTSSANAVGATSQNINGGLAPEKAAMQIMRAIEKGAFEAYIGKFSTERFALWFNRFLPGILIRMAPKFAPK